MDERLIGQYRVTGILGQGGMGVVYAAEHTLLDRPAAVKVLLPRLSGEQEIVTRFFNEARAATAIRHPGIVEIYDFGWTSDGSAFIVMEHLQGETLRARRKRAPIRWSTALALVRQIAGALGAAHAKGIVHRDLKPDNIFLVPDPEVPGGERIKLLDFGIAKLAGAVSSRHRTQTGTVMGTPTYMAPEQCRGVAVDSRADLYSLGCILFELCTGWPPFVGEGTGDVLAAHIHEPPPTIASLASSVPQELEGLVQRMLAKSPADRVQTAEELIRLIDAAKTSISQVARSGSHPVAAPATPSVDAVAPTIAPTVAPTLEGTAAPAPATPAPATPAPAPATPQVTAPARLDTTLSSAVGIRRRTTRTPARWWAVVGVVGGGLAIAGAVALTFARGGAGDAPIQAAAPPPVAESPPLPEGTLPPMETLPVPPPAPAPATAPAPAPAPTEPAPAAPPEPAPSPAPAAPPGPAPSPAPAAPSPAVHSASAPALVPPPQPVSPSAGGRAPHRKSSPSPSVPSSPSTGSPTVSYCSVKARTASTQIRIDFTSSPAGAEIYLNGGQSFGPTPGFASLRRGNDPLDFELRLPGYQPQKLIICPTETFPVFVRLRPSRAARP